MIILDMQTLDIAGHELFLQIKDINPDFKVLASSGYYHEEQARQIFNDGCDGFIQKPFGLKELSLKIRNIFAPER
jgi:two-component system, cell cycle sensor histidine kinase and response regulator CckA